MKIKTIFFRKYQMNFYETFGITLKREKKDQLH